VRQIEKKSDVNAISLDEIDTTAAWRAEAEEPVMEDAPDWLEEDDVEDHAISEELDEHVAASEGFQSHAESGNVPPDESDEPMPETHPQIDRPSGSSAGTSSRRRPPLPQPGGHQFRGSTRGRQTPVRGPRASRAPTSSSSSRGKAISAAVTFTRKRGRGN